MSDRDTSLTDALPGFIDCRLEKRIVRHAIALRTYVM